MKAFLRTICCLTVIIVLCFGCNEDVKIQGDDSNKVTSDSAASDLEIGEDLNAMVDTTVAEAIDSSMTGENGYGTESSARGDERNLNSSKGNTNDGSSKKNNGATFKTDEGNVAESDSVAGKAEPEKPTTRKTEVKTVAKINLQNPVKPSKTVKKGAVIEPGKIEGFQMNMPIEWLEICFGSNGVKKGSFHNKKGNAMTGYGIFLGNNKSPSIKVYQGCEAKGECKVARAMILDDSFKTKKGMKVGMTLQDIWDAYGKDAVHITTWGRSLIALPTDLQYTGFIFEGFGLEWREDGDYNHEDVDPNLVISSILMTSK